MAADIVSPQTRSRMMSGIKGKNTRPELAIRSALHRAGFRFRLHRKDLPGRPDLVFARHDAVLFVHGCFWHRHDCAMFRWPSTRAEFWREKLNGNAARDVAQQETLRADGWRVGIVWECALKGSGRMDMAALSEALASWLRSDQPFLEITGDAERSAG